MKRIALTYDDGPNPSATPALLDVLARHKTPAAFFLIGTFVMQWPKLVQRIAREGHAIGNHSTTHPNLTELTPAQITAELSSTTSALARLGIVTDLFRPPYGYHNAAVAEVATALSLRMVLWDITGFDWSGEYASQIVEAIERQITDRGGIILLHDGYHVRSGADRRSTVEATDMLIPRLQAREFRFVPLTELL